MDHRPADVFRSWLYPAAVALVYVSWLGYMMLTNSWALFRDYWPISATMALGSFVAGATAEGGAAVAFPVFTKAFQIPSSDARTFGLMIQSIGMTGAGAFIYTRRIPVLPRVIGWVSLGGILGQVLGTYLLAIPNPYPKIIFTFVSSAFGATLVLSHWGLKWTPRPTLTAWGPRYRALFFAIGVVGGGFASQTGSGIDMLTFIVLTLAFGINEKISTPTTVVIMGLNSVVGFFLHGAVSHDIGIAWDYWLVAVPIVIFGAPLGAYVASRVHRDGIVRFLLFLIALELATTIWLVPFSRTALLLTGAGVLLCFALFAAMLHYQRRFVHRLDEPPAVLTP